MIRWSVTGGIQATGNYPGKARTPEELMADIDKVFSLIPGNHKLNLHASYAIFEEGEHADRDSLSRSILQNGLLLQKREIWDWILIYTVSMIW